MKSWSVTAANNATADANIGWAEGMLAPQVNNSARAEMAAVKAFANQITGAKTSGGSANAQTFTSDAAGAISTAYAAGMSFTFKAGYTNSGACTFNVDGVGAVNIFYGGVALTSGMIVAGQIYEVVYDGTQFVLINPAQNPVSQTGKNKLVNGCGLVNQRAPATNADDTYCVDRWYILTQSNPASVTVVTAPESGARAAMVIQQANVSAQRIGVAQIVEATETYDIRSQAMMLAGRVKLGATSNVRYAVLEWTGGGDVVTSDIVADWTSTSYVAGGFFASSNVSVLASGVVACTSGAARDLTALPATVGASAENLIVFVWTESTAAQGVTLTLWNMQFERGARATPYEIEPYSTTLIRCQRFYEKSFAMATTPAQNAGTTGALLFGQVSAASAGGGYGFFGFQVNKRVAPTVTTYNPSASNAQIYNAGTGTDYTSTTAFAYEHGFGCTATAPGGSAVGQTSRLHFTADAEL